MVGVAGKSKGCLTCRKRKKGCDLARPACGQCVKGGRRCEGYRRELNFIHHKVPGQEHQSSASASASTSRFVSVSPVPLGSRDQTTFHSDANHGSTGVSIDSPSLSPVQDVPSLMDAGERYRHRQDSLELVQRQRSQQTPSLQLLPATLTLTALTTLHASLFNSFFLPRNLASRPVIHGSFPHPAKWAVFIPSLLNNEASLQLAYLALSTSRLGHANNDDNLLVSGKKIYGQALLEVQRAISDPKRRHLEETVLACSTLGLFEIFEAQTVASVRQGSTPNGWLSHAAGIARLVRARSPETYTTEKAHQTFLHTRIGISINACTTRKWCFLSEPEWLTVPWINHAKNIQHRLLDVMVFIPHVLETYDILQAHKGYNAVQRRRGRQVLLARCAYLSELLQQWFSDICAEGGDLPLWNSSPATEPSYPFPFVVSFDDYGVAHTIMLYWACSLMIQGTRNQLKELLNEDLAGLEATSLQGDQTEPRHYAVNIAQAMPYFSHPSMGALGPNLALFPLGIAFGYFAVAAKSSYVSDGINMESISRTMDGLMQGEPTAMNDSTTNVLSWFVKLFADLRSRSLPGGIFLSAIMKAIGSSAVLAAAQPAAEV